MKGKLLKAEVILVNQKAKFNGFVEGKEPIVIDYIPPLGDGEGYTSLELLLISLASCLGSTIKFMINGHLKKVVKELKLKIEGQRREQHPTSFEKIDIILEIKSDDLSEDELKEIISLAEKQFCPVMDLIKNNTEVNVLSKIKND